MQKEKNNFIDLKSDLLSLELPKNNKPITHMAVGAHPDDVEIFAFRGIWKSYTKKDCNFAAVVCTNGSGAPKYGEFSSKSSDEIIQIRKHEQKKAAELGRYASLVHFNYESQEIKQQSQKWVQDLKTLFELYKPRVIYTHSPFDEHETHRKTLSGCLKALHSIEDLSWLKEIYACEVWGSLDWLPLEHKHVLGENEGHNLQQELLECFYSQNVGSQKRYDLGTLGRKQGNATFFESNQSNLYSHQSYAIDLMPVFQAEKYDPYAYFSEIIVKHEALLKQKIKGLK